MKCFHYIQCGLLCWKQRRKNLPDYDTKKKETGRYIEEIEKESRINIWSFSIYSQLDIGYNTRREDTNNLALEQKETKKC